MAELIKSIVGHKNIKSRLMRSISEERFASCLLFNGPSGVGKKKLALACIQALFCETSRTGACGLCPSCIRVEKGQHENLLMVEPDSSQIKVDEVAPIQDFVRLRLLGRARAILINDAHLLNLQAANSLLKTLEEPPPSTYFFLITAQENLLPTTIRSRAQTVRVGPLTPTELSQIVVDAKPWMIASSQGRVDFLEQLQSADTESLRQDILNLLEAFLSGERIDAFGKIAALVKEKPTASFLISTWQQILRDSWLMKNSLNQFLHLDQTRLIQKVSQLSLDQLEKFYLSLVEIEKGLNINMDRVLSFENLWFELRA